MKDYVFTSSKQEDFFGPIGNSITKGKIVNKTKSKNQISLSIGSVVTGFPGSKAHASITGDYPNFILNLTIPTGQTGPRGLPGNTCYINNPLKPVEKSKKG